MTRSQRDRCLLGGVPQPPGSASGVRVGFGLRGSRHSSCRGPLPCLDAMLTALSLVGQWWQARRHVACWWVWISVVAVSLGKYLCKSRHGTAALYVV
ncbi:nicotinamide mononucleotide transporter, partial [Mycobacterium tuberculosis]|nr:nicotinamide mononucleotide transporter [Mycobacterium tuberculosis]